jgi:hypothetical protein
MRICLVLSTLLVCLFTHSSAHAQVPLRIDVSAERMRVDGALNEWKGARFVELGQGDDASVRYALAEADHGLYLGAEVRDDQLVSGEQGDRLVLRFAMPEADHWLETELLLAPGEAGKSKARALVMTGSQKAQLDPAIQLVEGPKKAGAGYVIEAFIPWASIAGAQIWEQGRGSLGFIDIDGPGDRPSTLGSAQGRGAELPQLAMGDGNRDLLSSFLQARELQGVQLRYDFRANVSGDAQPERVVIVDSYVVVYGPGYKRGETFNYFSLPYSVGGGLKSATIYDLTGDGRGELVVTVRQQSAVGTREVWLVFDLDDEGMQQLFGLEVKKELKGGLLESSVSIVPGKAGNKASKRADSLPRIEVRPGRASGLDERTYREQPSQGAEPILLPWGEVAVRSYGFDGKQFVVVDEVRQKTTLKPAGASVVASAPVAAALAPEAVTSADVLALFKTQQKLPRDAKPTRSLRANVLAGSAPEQVDVFGSVLVVTGPEVGDGKGYLTYGAPVSDARELLDVRAADVTGDRIDELLLRVRQPLGGAEAVERELLLVLRSEQGKLGRALAVEVLRRQRERVIENRVVTSGGTLAIEPGVARGFSEQSYPFSSESIAGVQRLLLPWSDSTVRYRLAGSVMVPTP